MKSQLPLLLVFSAGIFMVIQFFVPHGSSEFAYEYLLDWLQIIGVFTLAVGIFSLVRVSLDKIQAKRENWQYTLVTLAGLLVMVVCGFIGPDGQLHFMTKEGQENPIFKSLFGYVITPIQSTMFSLLAFFITSAAYRAFRARNVLSTILLSAALILMLRFTPYFGEQIGGLLSVTADWLMNVPNLAAQRAIVIGVGLGIVATAVKVVVGIERNYLGRG